MRCGIGPIPEDLKSLPRLSPSALSAFRETPSTYKAYVERKTETTDAMIEGTLIHMACLEPDKFFDLHISEPIKDQFPTAMFTTDDLKNYLRKNNLPVSGNKPELIERVLAHNPTVQIWERIVADIVGNKTMVSSKTFETCVQVSEKIKKRHFCSKIWKDSIKETYIWWVDEEFGILISAKPDLIFMSEKTNLCLDIKTVRDAHPKKFEREIYYENHFITAAIYLDGLSMIYNRTFDTFVWLAVTKKAPYIVQEYAADQGMIDAGRIEYKKLMSQWLDCYEKNEWPDYSDKVMNITLPEWAWNKIEDEYPSELNNE